MYTCMHIPHDIYFAMSDLEPPGFGHRGELRGGFLVNALGQCHEEVPPGTSGGGCFPRSSDRDRAMKDLETTG